MRNFLLATALTAITAPSAFAWTCPPGSTVCSASDSGSAAASQSLSSAHVGRITVSPTINVAAPTATASPSLVAAPAAATAPTSGSSNSGAAGDPPAKHQWNGGGHSNGSNVLVQQFPPASAFAAPLAGGPCNSSGVSAGAQTAWFGLTVAHQRFDYGCAGERMGNLMTVGQQLDWAYQCQDDERFRKASASIGIPCPGEERRDAAAHTVVTPVAATVPPTNPAGHNLANAINGAHVSTAELNNLSLKAAQEMNR